MQVIRQKPRPSSPEGVVKRSIPVEIDLDYCKGCGICAEECPGKAIEMVEEDEEA